MSLYHDIFLCSIAQFRGVGSKKKVRGILTTNLIAPIYKCILTVPGKQLRLILGYLRHPSSVVSSLS